MGPGGGDLDLLPRPRGLLDDGSETALGTGGGGSDLDLLLRPARGVLEYSETVVGGGDDLDLLAFLAAGAAGADDRLGITFLLRGRPGRGTSLALVLLSAFVVEIGSALVDNFGKLNDMCAILYSLILTGMDWLWKCTLDYVMYDLE